MDRAPACGAGDTSSIPVGRRTLKRPFLRREMAFFLYFLVDVPKRKKSKILYIVSGPSMVHSNRKDAILVVLFWDALVDIF